MGREVDREGRGMREGQAHPETVPFLFFLCLSPAFGERGASSFSYVFPLVVPFSFPLLVLLVRRRPYFGWQQSVVEETGYLEKPHRDCSGSGSAATMALRATCSGITNN